MIATCAALQLPTRQASIGARVTSSHDPKLTYRAGCFESARDPERTSAALWRGTYKTAVLFVAFPIRVRNTSRISYILLFGQAFGRKKARSSTVIPISAKQGLIRFECLPSGIRNSDSVAFVASLCSARHGDAQCIGWPLPHDFVVRANR